VDALAEGCEYNWPITRLISVHFEKFFVLCLFFVVDRQHFFSIVTT